jgi:hypothetical protein
LYQLICVPDVLANAAAHSYSWVIDGSTGLKSFEVQADDEGLMLDSVDDVTGDGIRDLLTRKGNQLEVRNASSRANIEASFIGQTYDERLGMAAASLGDLDGDGLPELVVSASHSDTGATNAGGAYVFTTATSGEPEPPAANNLLTNGGFEDGTTGWTGNGGAMLTSVTSPVQEGTQAILVSGRNSVSDGPLMDITDIISANGSVSYDLSGYFKGATATDTIKFVVKVYYGNKTKTFNVTGTVSPSGYALVSGSFTPTWNGGLSQVTLQVNHLNTTDDYNADNISLSLTPAP